MNGHTCHMRIWYAHGDCVIAERFLHIIGNWSYVANQLSIKACISLGLFEVLGAFRHRVNLLPK